MMSSALRHTVFSRIWPYVRRATRFRWGARNGGFWRQLLIRFHLFEVMDIMDWGALISRFDSRGLRDPMCLQRRPNAELMEADCELPHPDMIIWIWQADRPDSAPCLHCRPRAEFAPPGDSQSLIRPVRTDSVGNTAIGEEYPILWRKFGMAPNFELLAISGKLRTLHGRRVEQKRTLKSPDLGAKGNYIARLLGAPIHTTPAASRVESYLDPRTFGLLVTDRRFLLTF